MNRIFAMIFFALFPALVCAQAWTQREGGYYIKLALSRIDTRQEFNSFAQRAPLFSLYPGVHDGEYTSTDISLYAEYGISNDFTVIGATRLRSSNSEYSDSELVSRPNGGLGDVYLAGRLSLLDDPVSVAVQVGWKIPSADTGSGTAVALGDGQMDFDATAAAGWSMPLPDVPNHVQTKWGYLFRGGNYDNAIIYMEEIGVMLFHNRVGVHAAFDGVITQGRVVRPDTLLSNTGFGIRNNYTFSRLTAGVIIPLTQKAQLTLDWSTVMNGRATFAGNIITIGVAFNRVWDTPLQPKGK